MHYFSGKGCSEFLESMHYCIGILTVSLEELKLIADVLDVTFEQSFILPDGECIKTSNE